MNRRTFLQTVPGVAVLAGATSGSAEDAGKSGVAPELEPITLPKPETDGGKSVLAALRERRTILPDGPASFINRLFWR